MIEPCWDIFLSLGSFGALELILMLCCEISGMEMYWISVYRVQYRRFPALRLLFSKDVDGSCLGL